MLWQARLGMICGRGAIDAPAGGGSIWATFDGATANVTMSNGNLTATMNSNSADGGARSTSNKSSGKYYFEFTAVAPNGFADAVGIILSTGTFVDMQSNQLNTSEVYTTSARYFPTVPLMVKLASLRRVTLPEWQLIWITGRHGSVGMLAIGIMMGRLIQPRIRTD
jgi:hypothetical protein